MCPKKMPKGQPAQLPPAMTIEQQRQHLADLIGKLLARHWLAERQKQSGAKAATSRDNRA